MLAINLQLRFTIPIKGRASFLSCHISTYEIVLDSTMPSVLPKKLFCVKQIFVMSQCAGGGRITNSICI